MTDAFPPPPDLPDLPAMSDAALAEDLLTLRDLLRFGVTLLTRHEVALAHGTATPVDEAAFLILDSLDLPVEDINPWADARLTRPEREMLIRRLRRRVTERIPAPYLTGRAWLKGMPFVVDPRVIIPRSYLAEILTGPLIGGDGFTLIEEPDSVGRVLDLCTGSGCLAILAARVFAEAAVDAVELSPAAAAVAAENIRRHGLEERLTLREGDLWDPVPPQARYDLILSNPPYVTAEGMASLTPEHRQEPAMALDGGPDGLMILRRILDRAAQHLTPEGGLLVEVGEARAAVEAEWPDLPFLWLETETSSEEVFWLPAEALRA